MRGDIRGNARHKDFEQISAGLQQRQPRHCPQQKPAHIARGE
jgi:hypothetical protein